MKIVFMGTPQFAATILEGLYESGEDIVAVYTQPDKPVKRSGTPVASPVKEYALSKGLNVYQPTRIRNAEEVELLKTFDADLFVVAAYGQILSKEVLDIPKLFCVNAHGSILPKYRGASPIQRAIADGEEETGVTLMRMDEGIDTGDMIAVSKIPIEKTDDEASVYEKLATVATKLLIDNLKAIENGTATFTKQDDALSSYAPMIKKEEGLVDFTKSAHLIDCLVRGFKEWPGAYTFVGGKLLKILEVKEANEVTGIGEQGLAPGHFVVTKKNLYVTTGDGLLELLAVKPEGKKLMSGMDYQRGSHTATGDKAF